LLCLCILIVCLCMATLTEGFPCFFLSCKANSRVKPRKDGARPAFFLIFVLFYVERMDPTRLPKITIHWKPEGRKKTRPSPENLKRWNIYSHE
jgi:hypothetical protein